MKKNRSIVILHGLTAFCIIIQLASSQFMKSPIKHPDASIWQHLMFTIHIYTGLFTGLCIMAFTVAVLFKGKGWRAIFALFTGKTEGILRDIRTLSQRKLPEHTYGGLADTIQGFGLLLILATAFSGILWYLLSLSLGIQAAHPVLEWHKTFAGIVWWYIAGHAGMAILHEITTKVLVKNQQKQ